MNCPVDNETLQMTERSGVEVDYCPRCRGIWLDRGELDKLLERAEREMPPAYADRRDDDERGYRDRRYEEPRYDDRPSEYGRPRKKRKSFLSEMLDFD